MSLTTELSKILDSDDEPLPKRLKIADNIFHSNNLHLQSREAYLFNWITNIKTDNADTWKLFNNWLCSGRISNLNRIDLSQECVKNICNALLKNLNTNLVDDNIRRIKITSSLALINNSIFHEYFKLNLKDYFTLLAYIVEIMDDKNTILELLKNENLFDKIYFSSDKFYKYFFEILLPALAKADCEFNDDTVFHTICTVIQKNILQKSFKNFDHHLHHFFEDVDTPKYTVFKYFMKCLLTNTLATESNINVFRILFTCVCKEYCHNFLFIYRFSIIIFQILGFNLSDKFNLINIEKWDIPDRHIDKSLAAVLPILEILSIYKIDVTLEINGVKFSEFIRTFVLTTINFSPIPNEDSLKVIYNCIEIDPLIIDSVISEILQYILLKENNCYLIYIKFVISLFKVYSKLHRIQHLISKILSVLKLLVNKEIIPLTNIVPFGGRLNEEKITYEHDINNILPEQVLVSFKDCVLSSASWQVINLFKTFSFHLNSATDGNLQDIITDEIKLIYIEVVGIFLCEFLSSVRVMEHTIPNLVLNKFLKGIDELNTILGRFGNSLISVEHNHTLMKTYLSVCYTLGELYIALRYYSTNSDILLPTNQYKDDVLSNISYLHPYLTAEQWSLISERVTNFGKTPCKQLMQNLFIQNIKAMSLFENFTSEGIINSLIKNSILSLGDLWESIVNNSFILNTVLSKMEFSQIIKLSEVILNKIIESNEEVKISAEVLNSEILAKYFVYNLFRNINTLFKVKKNGNVPPCVKIFEEFDLNLLSQDYNDHELLKKLLITFNDFKLADVKNESFQIKLKKLSVYLDILKSIPMIYLPDDFKIYSTFYLIIVLNDLRNSNKCDSEVVDGLETFIIGLLRTMPKHFPMCVKYDTLLRYIVRNMKNSIAFTYILDNLLTTENFIERIHEIYSYLIEHEKRKHTKCIEILLTGLFEYKKNKMSPEDKTSITDCIKTLCEHLTKHILHHNLYSLHLLALIMKYNTNQEDGSQIEELFNCVQTSLVKYEDVNYEGTLLLFTVMLQHKSKFPDLSCYLLHWILQEDVSIPEALKKKQSQLTILCCEYFDNKVFSNVIEELNGMTMDSMGSDKFIHLLDVWNNILLCNFNPIKSNRLIQGIQNLLEEMCSGPNFSQESIKKFFEFMIRIAHTTHVQLTSTVLDMIMLFVSKFLVKDSSLNIYILCTNLLDTLLKHRKPLITDRLPSYLQQYRMLLQVLCKKSDINLQQHDIKCLSDSSQSLEMLTKNLITYGKYVARISPYLIADILNQYETISLLPAVKMHLDNCIYSFLELCDQHAISYLMRSLSTASTEMFKFHYDNFNKYYRYRGKV